MGTCAACKWSRRRCNPDCTFASYFPLDDPQKFAVVRTVFGANNVCKRLEGLPVHQRGDAANNLAYDANAWARDPVNGCVGEISSLKNQVSELEIQLAVAQAQMPCIQNHEAVKGENGKEAFETAKEKEPSVFAAAGERQHEAAEKRIQKMKILDLNEPPSDEDEDIMPKAL